MHTKPTPQQIIARARQAEALLRTGQPREAVMTLQPAMPFAEKVFPALVTYARSLAMLSQHGRAAAVFREAVDLRPSDAPVRTEFALALKRAGDFDQSLRQVRRARETMPWEPRSVMIEAELQMDLGREAEAVELLDGFEANAPADARTPHHMSHLCITRMRLCGLHRQTRRAGAKASRAPDEVSRRVRAGEPGSGPSRAQTSCGGCRRGGGVQRATGHGPATHTDLGAASQAGLRLLRRRFACLDRHRALPSLRREAQGHCQHRGTCGH
jgi:tetratricopeptide (TPR) repeat protein